MQQVNEKFLGVNQSNPSQNLVCKGFDVINIKKSIKFFQ